LYRLVDTPSHGRLTHHARQTASADGDVMVIGTYRGTSDHTGTFTGRI